VVEAAFLQLTIAFQRRGERAAQQRDDEARRAGT
jgi:hypothetical protein